MLLFASGVVAQNASAGNRPNIIIVLSDDQGYGDFSCYGNPILKTPYLDRLCGESIRFDNFHVTPLCTPTRGELISGLDALHNQASAVLTGRGLMRRDIVTMPEVLKANGYRTGIFGKWHLGDAYPDRPMDRGFEKCVWFRGWGLLSEIEYDNDYYRTRYLDSLSPVQSDEYCTDLWFDQAMQWMGRMSQERQPFFAYIPLNAAHGPFQGPKKNTDVYRAKGLNEPTANFFGMIANIDEDMKRLDEWLVRNNLYENTILLFMTDNGGTGGIKVYNAGMRGEKASNYEGGHRAACFLRWPGGLPGRAETIHYPTEIQDWLPTFMDLLNLNKPGQSFDGVSLKPQLLHPGAKVPDRLLVVQYTAEREEEDGSVHSKKYDGCVVYNDWRLIGDTALYDLSADPGQEHSVISANPAIFREMHDYYERWWKRVSTGVDEILPTYVGASQDNPVILNSNSWSGKGVNTQWGVALGAGPHRGGVFQLYAMKSGRYKIELSRWPFHLNRQLTEKGPARAVGGTPIREGKALPIAFGAVVLNGDKQKDIPAPAGAIVLSTELNIKKGSNTLRAWFLDSEGNDLAGAFYVRITKL